MEYEGVLVGLGNPGSQYVGTRHNLGFELVDFFLREAENKGRVESLSGAKFRCELWRCTLWNSPKWWLVAKPLTFMNLSGQSIQPLLAWHKISLDKLIVAHDELDLAPGKLRFKTGGGNAGHNGLKSLCQHLGAPDFHRLRMGIGRPQQESEMKHRDVSDYVLTRPTGDEIKIYEQILPKALQLIEIFYKENSDAAKKYALRL